jgi:hypothetical protein
MLPSMALGVLGKASFGSNDTVMDSESVAYEQMIHTKHLGVAHQVNGKPGTDCPKCSDNKKLIEAVGGKGAKCGGAELCRTGEKCDPCKGEKKHIAMKFRETKAEMLKVLAGIRNHKESSCNPK